MRPLILSLTLAAALPLGAQPADTIRRSPEPLWDKQDALIAAGFVVGTIAMFPLDRKVAERLQDTSLQTIRFAHHQATNFRLIGSPGSYFIGATLYAVGRLARQKEVADLGLHGTEAILVGEGLTGIIKNLAGRQRPDSGARGFGGVADPHDFGFARGFKGDRYRSFPSGHTVAGFAAAAAVVSETHRWWPNSTWYVAPVMYGGATLIGLSRMYNNRHWASDVVMGAAIGSFAGRKVVRYHHSHPGNDIDRILLGATVVPSADGGSVIVLTIAPR